MVNYHLEVLKLLTQYDCQRLNHIGNGIFRWHSPITNLVFNVDDPIRSINTANEILKRAGIGPIIKQRRAPP